MYVRDRSLSSGMLASDWPLSIASHLIRKACRSMPFSSAHYAGSAAEIRHFSETAGGRPRRRRGKCDVLK